MALLVIISHLLLAMSSLAVCQQYLRATMGHSNWERQFVSIRESFVGRKIVLLVGLD